MVYTKDFFDKGIPAQCTIEPNEKYYLINLALGAFNTQNLVRFWKRQSTTSLKSLFEISYEIYAACAHYEHVLSHTNPDSALFKLNHSQETIQTVDDPLKACLAQALSYCEQTHGLFDITIGRLIALWQDYLKRGMVPPKKEIDKKLYHYSFRDICLRDNQYIRSSADVHIALGGIAKGWIADKIATLLQSYEVDHALINLGGNVLVYGETVAHAPWSIGIREPLPTTLQRPAPVIAVYMQSGSVVTSGIYERATWIDETLYHHILDPRYHYPASSDLLSASVISQHSIDGDGYSTALIIMGLHDAFNFIESLPGIEAIFLTKDHRIVSTSGITWVDTPPKTIADDSILAQSAPSKFYRAE